MITPSSMPQFRMSQGIVCSSPSLTITPYLTDAWTFNRPIEQVTRQNIYDENTGEIKYVQETPRFEKDNYNLNYGISAQINIPLGKSPALCHEATMVNIEAQKLLIKKTKMEISLFRLEQCAKQAKLGVTFKPNTPSAVTCEDIVVNIPPNQVIPHTHEIRVDKSRVLNSSTNHYFKSFLRFVNLETACFTKGRTSPKIAGALAPTKARLKTPTNCGAEGMYCSFHSTAS